VTGAQGASKKTHCGQGSKKQTKKGPKTLEVTTGMTWPKSTVQAPTKNPEGDRPFTRVSENTRVSAGTSKVVGADIKETLTEAPDVRGEKKCTRQQGNCARWKRGG